jgi:uncharacterized membrane protein YdjX (TVP38/TMEM64 family)
VLYLRLVYFPFTPMNFGMGLTGVTFRDYFYGTGLGILVGTFIFTFFIGTLREVWGTGEWAQLLSPQVFLSVALFVFSFFIPKILKALRGEKAPMDTRPPSRLGVTTEDGRNPAKERRKQDEGRK